MAFKGDLESLVLGVLQDGELHGYEISKRIKAISAQALQVGEGQLYPALHGLERDGLISAVWIPTEGKPARKVYSLTDSGRAALVEKRKAWEAFANGVNNLLNPVRPVGEGGRG